MLWLAAGAGCDSLLKRFDDTSPSQPGAGLDEAGIDENTETGRREVAGYLTFLDVLDGTDEQSWHTIFEHTLAAYKKDSKYENRLRLALVMSRADRKSSESRVTRNLLADARTLLDETVHDTEHITPLVRKFAQLQLTELDARLALYDEVQRLKSQLARAHQESQTAQRDRSEAVARMRRIDAALAEANAKLEAVMDIERSVGPAGKETFP